MSSDAPHRARSSSITYPWPAARSSFRGKHTNNEFEFVWCAPASAQLIDGGALVSGVLLLSPQAHRLHLPCCRGCPLFLRQSLHLRNTTTLYTHSCCASTPLHFLTLCPEPLKEYHITLPKYQITPYFLNHCTGRRSWVDTELPVNM